ncbi:Variant-specific surface protein, partial [Giardia duodenalis]
VHCGAAAASCLIAHPFAKRDAKQRISLTSERYSSRWCFLFMGGCYNARAAPGSGVCREARDGACVGYAEENKTDKTSAGIIRAGAEETPTCEAVTDSNSVSTKCAQGKCDITIGGNPYCSKCSKLDEHLVDGKCVAASGDANSNCVSDNQGSCTSCANSYFMYQGGCYQTGGQNPGNTLCTAASDGKCTTAAEGYFVPPGATASKQSVVKCDDTTGVEVSSNTYKGVDKCATCTAPSSVTVREAKAAICESCIEGYYVDSDGSVCTQCADTTNCAVCLATGTNKGKCTECKSSSSNNYLKITDTETQSGDCVAQAACTGTHFPVAADRKCYPCSNTGKGGIASCQTCSKTETTLKCLTCSDPKKPNTTGTACVACNIANCANCNEENVCEACTNSKKLSPLKDACLDSCPAGTYDNTNICTPCHTSCAECNNSAEATSCTACYPGHVLNKTDSSTTGTCIPECTGRYAENCEAGMCTAVLGGSRYCSRCKSGYVPVDGLCVSSGTKEHHHWVHTRNRWNVFCMH